MSAPRFPRRRFIAFSAAAAATVPYARVASGQSYATKPVRLVVGNSVGGSNDHVARLLAPFMAERLGQSVVIDNKPGAAGNIGLESVVKAPPDGYTLFMGGSNMLASAHTRPIGINPVTDLEHVSMFCEGYMVYTVNTIIPATNAAEFIALAKKQPGKLNYGTPGAGGNIHVSVELFKLRAGIDLAAIHYKSMSNVYADILSNEIQMSVQTFATLEAQRKAGKQRALFVASRTRDPQFADVPTSVELGISDLEYITNWFGVHAPRGTPPAIVKTLNSIVAEAAKSPPMRERLLAGGFEPVGNASDEFKARVAKDYAVIGETVRLAGVRAE
jgi:tripartite-type tricarboxylate transporter receptor subunit TctC